MPARNDVALRRVRYALRVHPAAKAVVYSRTGEIRLVTSEQLLEQAALLRRWTEIYDPDDAEEQWFADCYRELADELEQKTRSGRIDDDLLDRVYQLEERGPVDDPTLGPQAARVVALRPYAARRCPQARRPAVVVRVARRGFRRTRRSRRARAPGRPGDDEPPPRELDRQAVAA